MAGELVVVPKDPKSYLSEKESKALEEYTKRNSPPMSPHTAGNFFTLFVEGYSLEQMLETNRAWGLGALADARVRYQWDERRETYVDDIHRQAMDRLRKLQSESINFLADMAAVAHAELRQEMQRYLLNPTEENLPSTRLKTIKEYETLLNTIEKVGRLGQAAPVSNPVSVNVADGGQVSVVVGSGTEPEILKRLAESTREKVLKKSDLS